MIVLCSIYLVLAFYVYYRTIKFWINDNGSYYTIEDVDMSFDIPYYPIVALVDIIVSIPSVLIMMYLYKSGLRVEMRILTHVPVGFALHGIINILHYIIIANKQNKKI